MSTARMGSESLLLSIATLVGLAAIGEAAVRVLAPFPSWAHERSCAFPGSHHPRLGWTGIPDRKQLFTQDEFDVWVEFNGMGFRDDDFAAKSARAAASGATRVVLLGDSFAWGWGVEREERLGEQLAGLDGNLAPFHLAHCGWGTDQAYLAYLEHGSSLEADLVLLFLFANDFFDVSADARHEGQRKPRFALAEDGLRLRGVPVPDDPPHWERKRALSARRGACPPSASEAARPAWREGLARVASHSQLANWLGFRLGQLRAPALATPRPAFAYAARAPLVAALVDALARRAGADGAHFALVLVPEKRQVLDAETSGAWQALLRAHCARAGLACLDLLPAFSGRDDTYFRVDPHWNRAGHRLAARRLHAFLVERGWLAQRSRAARSAAVSQLAAEPPVFHRTPARPGGRRAM